MTQQRSRLTLHLPRGPTPSLDCKERNEIPALLCVRIVCRNGPEVLRLPHIVEKLHELLDFSIRWTFTQSCDANLLHLVRRVLATQHLQPLDSGLRFPGVRQWQFTEGMLKAVSNGNFELVKLLSMTFQGCFVPSSVINEAAKFGRCEILHWLVANRRDVRWTDREVAAAIRGDHFELAKWMQEQISSVSVVMAEQWAAIAAGEGNLEMLKWVCSLSVAVGPRYAVFDAVDNGHLEVVKWIMNRPDRDARGASLILDDQFVLPPLQITLKSATKGGYFDVVEWMLQNYPEKCRIHGADADAAVIGRLDFVKLFYECHVECSPQGTLNAAATGGHLEVVKWLHEHQSGKIPLGQAINCAAKNGFLNVVEWLHEHTSEGCTTFAMDGAAANGHFDVVQWLHKHRPEGCTNIAVDSAAEKGNLEIVKWLTVNRKESCSPAAINLASANGHLDVVKWLHDNRREGCTIDAMNRAAGNGHLEVVKWLHAKRSEGCTSEAMDNAATNGYLDVVKWLHNNRSEGCTSSAMNGAARNNHLAVVKWLCAHRTEGCTTSAMDGAAKEGHLEMIKFLGCTRHEGCSTAAIEAAVLDSHFDVALWISQHHSEYDIADALRRCTTIQRRWEFIEWIYALDPALFELRFAERLLIE